MFQHICWVVLLIEMVAGHGLSKFQLRIREKQARFTQDIHTDMYKNHVFYHTPAHNSNQESMKMQDFNKGLQLFCIPAKQECYVTSLNRTIYPHAGKLMESISHMWNQGMDSITDTEAVTIHQNWIKSKEITDMTFMSQEMREFKQQFNFPVFFLKNIPTDAEIIPGNETMPSTLMRHARDDNLIQSNRQCRNDVAPKHRYGYVGSNDCDWLVFCDGPKQGAHVDNNGHFYGVTGCSKAHVVDHIFYTCLCCPEDHRVSECIFCTEVKNDWWET